MVTKVWLSKPPRMGILVNWFEVTFDRKEFTLPLFDVSNSEKSSAVLNQFAMKENRGELN